jgi:hypothetical protein
MKKLLLVACLLSICCFFIYKKIKTTYINKKFQNIVGSSLPLDARLIANFSEGTQDAYIWFCKNGVTDFNIPNSLNYDLNFSEWTLLKSDGFGVLSSGAYNEDTVFKIFKTNHEHVAVGKSLKLGQIIFSRIDTD